jgi:hypothetical protein
MGSIYILGYTTNKITVLHILILRVSDQRWENKRF